jgi:antitoxin (DNA-binding transcriptional repressor) of toxin-antitoxin stability system
MQPVGSAPRPDQHLVPQECWSRGTSSKPCRRRSAPCSTRLPRYNDRMSTISVQDIQRDPLAFLQRVEAGEAFVVVRGERALAEVRPLANATDEPRPFGLCAGRFTVPADFDAPLPEEILREFEGS